MPGSSAVIRLNCGSRRGDNGALGRPGSLGRSNTLPEKTGHPPRVAIGELLRFVRHLADDETIAIDEIVARAEQATGHRNIALAHYMKAFGTIRHEPELRSASTSTNAPSR